jgi:hypothetical protein
LTEYFATAPGDEFFWWCLGSGILTLGGFFASFLYLHRTRLMENMPTSRLRSAAQGYIELEGDARLMEGPPIIAPLTKAACVWWRFKVEERRSSGKNKNWVTFRSGLSDDCFELHDGTGRCVVDPDGAKVIPHHRQVWYGSRPAPDIAPAIGSGWLRAGFGKYRYTEERLHPREPLYALGAFRTQTGVAEAFDERLDLNELLGKWKHDAAMMALFDTNKDGTVDAKEWEAVRRMAVKKVRDEHVQRAVETPDLHILAKPRDGRPYILSGVAQAALIRRYRLQSAGALALAAIAAGVLLTALLSRGFIT